MKRIEGEFAFNSHFVESTLSQTKTPVSVKWLNSVQEEIAAVIEEAGIRLDQRSTRQLGEALDQQFTGYKKTFDLPKKFTEFLDWSRFDLLCLLNTNAFAYLSDHASRFGLTPISSVKLSDFKLDHNKEISAHFKVAIARHTVSGNSYIDYMPYTAQYMCGPSLAYCDFSEIKNCKCFQLGRHDERHFPKETPECIKPMLSKDLSLKPSWHLTQDHGLHTYDLIERHGDQGERVGLELSLNLQDWYLPSIAVNPASLLIDRDGQFHVIAENSVEGEDPYPGRITIVDLKKVPP